jgi:putative cardiolipin synthase
LDRTHVALDTRPNISVRLFNPRRNRDDIIRRGFTMLLRAFLAIRRMHNKVWMTVSRGVV